MPRRAAPTPALALAVLGAACAPTGSRDHEPEPTSEQRPPPFARPSHSLEPSDPPSPGADLCGAITIEPTGSWMSAGAQLDEVRDGWDWSVEYGRPVAIREALPPVSVPGHRFWEVEVAEGSRPIQPCFTRDGSISGPALEGCVDVWTLIGEATPEARPRTAEQWALLLGLLEGASAVYPDAASLERCVEGLPPRVRALVPPLGLRRSGTELHVAFVERVGFGRELTMLVTVHAILEDRWLNLEHEELWVMEREVAR